jgi:hypothetical protein
MNKKIWIAVSLAVVYLTICEAYAVVKCAPDGRGGVCCWDTDKDGPWKPIEC